MVNVEYFQTRLVARRTELEHMIADIENQLDEPHSQDFSEQATEREEDEVLESREKAELEELRAIDAALARIENGVYGICMSCEEEISHERLEAVPHATLCRHCMGR